MKRPQSALPNPTKFGATSSSAKLHPCLSAVTNGKRFRANPSQLAIVPQSATARPLRRPLQPIKECANKNLATRRGQEGPRGRSQPKKTPVLSFDEQALLKSSKEVAKHALRFRELDQKVTQLETGLGENRTQMGVEEERHLLHHLAQLKLTSVRQQPAAAVQYSPSKFVRFVNELKESVEEKRRETRERDCMLEEDMCGLRQELERFEMLISDQMDKGTQDELAQLRTQIRSHEESLKSLGQEEKELKMRLEKTQTAQAEAQFECEWLQQRESQRFESLMTKEVCCHLLSKKPFVCSLSSAQYVNSALLPGFDKTSKLANCLRAYLTLAEQMYLRAHASNRLRILIINDETSEEDYLLQICESLTGMEPTLDEIAQRRLKLAMSNTRVDFVDSEEALATLQQLLAIEKAPPAHKPQTVLLAVFTATTRPDLIQKVSQVRERIFPSDKLLQL